MHNLFYITCVLVLMMSPSMGAYDAYMQLSKNGALVATDAKHSWVKIIGFDRGVKNQVNVGSTAGGIGSTKLVANEVTMQMAADGSIAEMTKGIATGAVYKIRLQLARTGGDGYTSVLTEVIFDGVVFAKIKTTGSDGDEIMVFDISFLYAELIVAHTAVDAQGGVVSTTAAGWDFIENKSLAPSSVTPELGDYTDVTTPPPVNLDRDNDLIPNSWEELYGLNPDSNLDAGLDPDSDHFTNLEEYIAGTHPKQGNSFFRVKTTLVSKDPSPKVELIWTGVAGRTYQVLVSTGLTNGFTVIHTVTPATNGVQTYQPAMGSGPFFRLSVKK